MAHDPTLALQRDYFAIHPALYICGGAYDYVYELLTSSVDSIHVIIL
jgi:hypothetical protein